MAIIRVSVTSGFASDDLFGSPYSAPRELYAVGPFQLGCSYSAVYGVNNSVTGLLVTFTSGIDTPYHGSYTMVEALGEGVTLASIAYSDPVPISWENTEQIFYNSELFRVFRPDLPSSRLSGNDDIEGNAGKDTLNGYGGNDQIRGLGDDDNLNGGGGNDTLSGGDGSDRLHGEAGDDILDGGAGADYLVGGDGVDTVTYAGTFVSVTADLDTGSGSDGDIYVSIENITGSGVADTLTGNSNGNVINGGSGADVMTGRSGNDNYIVDDAGDQTIEAVGEGNDTVRATINWTLADNVERLVLLFGTQSGTGNAGANELYGNAANNVLNGRAGADRMEGFGGNDSYFVDVVGDQVIEAAGGGIDTVRAWTSWTLGANLERLQLLGTTQALNGAGNSLNNEIFGNAGDNRLAGLAGNDTLTGGAGLDTFIFNTPLNAATNVDTITDFSVADDTIRLDDAIFTAAGPLGTLAAAAFTIGSAATTAAHRIVYNSTTGALIYDSNGSAAGGATQFAILDAGLALTNADFLVA